MRTVYLMCGDWHLAEDQTQNAMAKVYTSWARIQRVDQVDTYVHRILFRTFVDTYRRRRQREILSAAVPDVAGAGTASDVRLTLLAALAKVTPRYRAVLVLRFWEDRSVDETAAALGISKGTGHERARTLGKRRRKNRSVLAFGGAGITMVAVAGAALAWGGTGTRDGSAAVGSAANWSTPMPTPMPTPAN